MHNCLLERVNKRSISPNGQSYKCSTLIISNSTVFTTRYRTTIYYRRVLSSTTVTCTQVQLLRVNSNADNTFLLPWLNYYLSSTYISFVEILPQRRAPTQEVEGCVSNDNRWVPPCRNRQKYRVAQVQWLQEETHKLKVVSLNAGTRYWMDIFHTYLL